MKRQPRRVRRTVVLPLLLVGVMSVSGCERIICVLPDGNGAENGNGSAGGLCLLK